MQQITDASSGISLESLTYLGYGDVLKREHAQSGVDLSYVGTGPGEGGDKYVGLDRFGRVVDQHWSKSGTAVDRRQHGYDRSGNRLFSDQLVTGGIAFRDLYAYDNLNRLTSWTRGDLNSTRDAIVTGTSKATQDWLLTTTGNWNTFTYDPDGAGSGAAVSQTRTHNRQNQITNLNESGKVTPGYDSNGNTTKDETDQRYTYDAWNRLVAVKTSTGTTLQSYAYDAANRRVEKQDGSNTRALYYSGQWQVIEERVGGVVKVQYVWSPVYVDAMVLRDRDANGNSGDGLEQRHYVLQDANFNVVALANTSGTILERFACTPYGEVLVLDANWALDADGISDHAWVHLHQGLRYDAVAKLYDNRRRWYSPTLGRFLSQDPAGYVDGGNLYEYNGGHPVVYLDPIGEARITLSFFAYIPSRLGRHVSGSPLPNARWIHGPPLFMSYMYAPDNFSAATQAGTSRVRTDLSFDSQRIGSLSTSQISENTYSDPTHQIMAWHGGGRSQSLRYIPNTWQVRQANPTGRIQGVLNSRSPCNQSNITLFASGGNPFFSLGPIIDYELTFEVTKSGTAVGVAGSGSHNAFPAYGAMGNGTVLYDTGPTASGPTLWNLGFSLTSFSIPFTRII